MVYRNLASERVRIDMTQKVLAEKLGVSIPTIRKWEMDISNAPAWAIRELADLFQCSADYLAGRTNDRLMHSH